MNSGFGHRAMCAVALCGSAVGAARGQPSWQGNLASVYATATNPFELAFGPDGVLFAGQHSPSNGAADIYRIPAGGGAAVAFGSITPQDPDGIDVYDGYVYASTEGPVYRTEIATGITSIWATAAGTPNQSTMTIDKHGDYFDAGTVIVGNARATADIQLLSPGNPAQSLVSSPSLDVVRALQFAAGELYCTEADEDKGVWTIASNGTITQVFDGGHAWSLPDAMVYHAPSDSFIVGDGSHLYSLARTGGTVQLVGSGFGLISGLTFDDVGRLYVSDRANHVVWQVVPAPGASAVCLAALPLTLTRRRRNSR